MYVDAFLPLTFKINRRFREYSLYAINGIKNVVLGSVKKILKA